MAESIDPVELARALIRRPSVTPADEGALDVLEGALAGLGFTSTRLKFEDVDNLYASRGDKGPNFCFAGHTDVVPPGNEEAWTAPPFAAELRDEFLYGRGASDMKCAIAAFVSAAGDAISKGICDAGQISLLITGDEEGPALHGTRKVLDWLHKEQININHCLVGEPSNPDQLGDMIKVGRRGSINCWLTVTGRQGHVAYPHRADNPIPTLLRKLLHLSETPVDEGYARFQPSNLEVTDISIGNTAHNVIPEKASARFNIRFNPNWTGASIDQWIRDQLTTLNETVGAQWELETIVSGEAFLTTDADFLSILADAVKEQTGRDADLSTSGGTSDARFIKDYAPVAEFGMVGATMHQIDEHVAVADILALRDIYLNILQRYFEKFGKA